MMYAQEKGGQKLHLVHIIDGRAMLTALCGREPKNGFWGMTINLPMGHACQNCIRAAAAGKSRTYVVLP
jgi:hypothetical protein